MKKYAGDSVLLVADKVVRMHDDKLQRDKGIVAMAPEGNIGFSFNTGFMKLGFWDADGEPFITL